jgi:hypothetical protein
MVLFISLKEITPPIKSVGFRMETSEGILAERILAADEGKATLG